ncbi:MAG: 16S rRNA (cytosine967-C5)-methyltransferase [Gammaproteobacteria bacterium]
MAKNKSDKCLNPRWQSLQTLLKVIDNGQSLDQALPLLLQGDAPLEARDYSFCAEITNGTCRYYFGLKVLLSRYLKKSLRRKDSDIEIILIQGLYELIFMRTHEYASVNETVGLCRLQSKEWARGLVNGVLRKVAREALSSQDIPAEDTYPEWMVELISKDWPSQKNEILIAGNKRAPMTLRVDTRQISVEDLLTQDLPDATPHNQINTAITLNQPMSVGEIPGFEKGLVSVQDASAQLAAILLDLQPGQKILDACAAPGGKTLHIAQLQSDLQIDAADISEVRLERVAQNLDRAGVKARMVCADVTQSSGDLMSNYDRILADVPCSGSGVVRRHSDIRLLRRKSDMANLVKNQQVILDQLWQRLKSGGRLVYSTCSIFRQENEDQIRAFLVRQADATEIKLDSVEWGHKQEFGRQILPGEFDMDGFYYACLEKR